MDLENIKHATNVNLRLLVLFDCLSAVNNAVLKSFDVIDDVLVILLDFLGKRKRSDLLADLEELGVELVDHLFPSRDRVRLKIDVPHVSARGKGLGELAQAEVGWDPRRTAKGLDEADDVLLGFAFFAIKLHKFGRSIALWVG